VRTCGAAVRRHRVGVNGDIRVITSTDGGSTWSQPVVVVHTLPEQGWSPNGSGSYVGSARGPSLVGGRRLHRRRLRVVAGLPGRSRGAPAPR
jgi:hypothetical protein